MRRHLLLILLLLPPLAILTLAIYAAELHRPAYRELTIFQFSHVDTQILVTADNQGIQISQIPNDLIANGPSRSGTRTYFPGITVSRFSTPLLGIYDLEIEIDYWFLLALTTLPVTLLLLIRLRQYLRRRHRLLNPTLCPTCSYDLRATPARCPECGTPKSATPQT